MDLEGCRVPVTWSRLQRHIPLTPAGRAGAPCCDQQEAGWAGPRPWQASTGLLTRKSRRQREKERNRRREQQIRPAALDRVGAWVHWRGWHTAEK